MSDDGYMHLLILGVRTDKTACGKRVHNFYPHTKLGLIDGIEGLIGLTISPAAVTCPRCVAAMERPADIRVTTDEGKRQ
jgi:hypothetical protein